MPERLRLFGTSLVGQCPEGLLRPDLKSTHNPWVFEDKTFVEHIDISGQNRL